MKKVTNSNNGKRTWVRPEVTQIKAGAAESRRGNVPDGGGGNQGS